MEKKSTSLFSIKIVYVSLNAVKKTQKKSETQLSVFNYGLKSEIQIAATLKFTYRKKNNII